MGEFILFVGFLGLVAGLFRHLRKREIDAFMEADLSVFQEFAARRDEIGEVPKSEERAFAANNVVSLRSARSVRKPEVRYVARDAMFDEIHRHFLGVLERVLDNRFRVFVHVPLNDFLRDATGNADLRNRFVSFLVCDRAHLRIACGIMLQGASPMETTNYRFLEEVFRQIDKPLIAFPMLASYSHREVREKIGSALKASLLSRVCPKCGGDMAVRRVVKGINAGKTFWVCKAFPTCKGVLRTGRW